MGTVGPSFTVNESALALLVTMPDAVPIERLVDLGIHPSIETALRGNGCLTMEKSTVYEWITRGIPGPGPCPKGEPGPCPKGEPGPSGAIANSLPWYVTHLMKQSKRNRVR